MPVMVCMDGFILTHAVERVDLPEQIEVDAFLPPYEPRQVLDVNDPHRVIHLQQKGLTVTLINATDAAFAKSLLEKFPAP